MPRVGLDTGLPVSNPWHRFTLTRLPEPSVLAPLEPTSLSPVGVAPVPSAPQPQLRCPPTARRRPANPIASPQHPSATSSPVPPNAPAGPRFRRPPEGGRRPGLTRLPLRSPVAVADPSLPPASRRSPTARSEVAVNTVRAPIPLSPRERCGLGRSPLLTAPVGVRSPERASVNTPDNPWSRGIFEFTGLSPKLSCYPQDFFRRPLVAHRSCTTMCTDRRALRRTDCIRAPNGVQWSPMTNQPVAAIIIIL